MGDTAEDKLADNPLEETALQQSKEILRESKPSENISINSAPKTECETPEITISKGPANTETVFSKLEINDKSNSSSDSAVIDEVKVSDSKDDPKERSSDRNKSDIFSLDDKIKSENAIFSINGTPSGRISRRRGENSEVFPVGCMGCKESKDENSINTPQLLSLKTKVESNVKESKSRPVSGKFSNRKRNPLTGAGVASTDEMKKTNSGRRKDGNPVLGLGYDTTGNVTASATRVPPGGYSKGLW